MDERRHKVLVALVSHTLIKLTRASKSIKFPKLYKANINKPKSEKKKRLKNFEVKPPKRGIELGWVIRGTRPKKPSSSFCGFACEARGARGSWGSKTV
jgi:hypothetical protein